MSRLLRATTLLSTWAAVACLALGLSLTSSSLYAGDPGDPLDPIILNPCKDCTGTCITDAQGGCSGGCAHPGGQDKKCDLTVCACRKPLIGNCKCKRA